MQDQLKNDLEKNSGFSLQLYEYRDISDTAQLAVVMIFLKDFSVKEEILKQMDMRGQTRVKISDFQALRYGN